MGAAVAYAVAALVQGAAVEPALPVALRHVGEDGLNGIAAGHLQAEVKARDRASGPRRRGAGRRPEFRT